MTEVILHVYDVTNSDSDKTNNTIVQINKISQTELALVASSTAPFRSVMFEQVYGDEEWSFGFCEHGTGVFHCPSMQNPMYTYRESIKLGETTHSVSIINQIIRELSREWPGESYDLLAKNCNHFCDKFCERLGVSKLPGWVNRFANAGDTTVEIAGNTADRFRHAKTEIVTASNVLIVFLLELHPTIWLPLQIPPATLPGSRTSLHPVRNLQVVQSWQTRISYRDKMRKHL
ncbi:deSI-like protein isoform X1 [Salvia divinorum]|uniref:DeSI-like protein isoform X1 n=1 Tax=Salvia divinorum TaxID=28513 RepID=A0ABD1FIQ6_SALDI